ncbi:MAG: hypothetical protein J7498_12645 [Sphingobium sp.]|nr:hypothetical protein [Sphingobium sp.]
MMDRRDLLKIGVATPVALGFPAVLRAATAGISLWVRDDRFDAAQPAAALSRSATLIDGDVTPLWTGMLDDAWRKRGFVVAGVTGSDALFVLEQLAWSRGRRVIERSEIAPAKDMIERSEVRPASDGRPALVRWIIAPVHPSVTA